MGIRKAGDPVQTQKLEKARPQDQSAPVARTEPGVLQPATQQKVEQRAQKLVEDALGKHSAIGAVIAAASKQLAAFEKLALRDAGKGGELRRSSHLEMLAINAGKTALAMEQLAEQARANKGITLREAAKDGVIDAGERQQIGHWTKQEAQARSAAAQHKARAGEMTANAAKLRGQEVGADLGDLAERTDVAANKAAFHDARAALVKFEGALAGKTPTAAEEHQLAGLRARRDVAFKMLAAEVGKAELIQMGREALEAGKGSSDVAAFQGIVDKTEKIVALQTEADKLARAAEKEERLGHLAGAKASSTQKPLDDVMASMNAWIQNPTPGNVRVLGDLARGIFALGSSAADAAKGEHGERMLDVYEALRGHMSDRAKLMTTLSKLFGTH